MNRLLMKGVVLPCAFSLVFLYGCREEKTKQEATPRPIAWIKVKDTDLSQVRRLSGIVQSAETASLSFEIGGKVKTVQANLGDHVTKGEILAKLDEQSYQLNFQAAKGRFQEAQAHLGDATNKFNRQSKLFKQGWTSRSAFDKAKADLESAKSGLKIAQAKLDLSTKDLGDTALKAPYDGNITARFIEPSQQITAGQTCFAVEGVEGLEISVRVPENLVGLLKKNHVVEATFPAIESLAVKAQIIEVGSQAEASSGFPVTLRLLKEAPNLKSGMTAEVDFTFIGKGRTGYQGRIILVPPTALTPGKGQKTYIFVYDEKEGVVRKRFVQTENIIDNKIMLSKGLKSGEIIATAGVSYLYDGQKVTLLGVGPKRYSGLARTAD